MKTSSGIVLIRKYDFQRAYCPREIRISIFWRRLLNSASSVIATVLTKKGTWCIGDVSFVFGFYTGPTSAAVWNRTRSGKSLIGDPEQVHYRAFDNTATPFHPLASAHRPMPCPICLVALVCVMIWAGSVSVQSYMPYSCEKFETTDKSKIRWLIWVSCIESLGLLLQSSAQRMDMNITLSLRLKIMTLHRAWTSWNFEFHQQRSFDTYVRELIWMLIIVGICIIYRVAACQKILVFVLCPFCCQPAFPIN